jgi:putative peptide zinc metalloprotease protein
MNIVRALDVALPELPERLVRQTLPKLDPSLVSKQHIENGQPVVLVKKPGAELVFRFAPSQWQLVQMFDGKRSYAEICDLYQQQTGSQLTEDDVRDLASYLQENSPLLYKTPLEQNMILQQELRSSRKKRSRFKGIDFSDITVKVWNNADAYVSWLYPKLRFMFTEWFVWTSLGMFALMTWMWADRLGEIWSDSFAFYNFTQKTGTDLLEFWFLFGAMAGIHETAHGLVGKHFGARVERMGFSLMYFAPSFFCDATQVWVLGGKWARIATSIAGIWLDLVVCFVATIVWWTTPTGMGAHNWAYKIMMVTGIGVSILNLNPLIKLDGYLIFSELVHEPALKEESTAYLSAWVRRSVFRLPVQVPYVPRRKRPFYVIYAVLSGLYSYLLLSFLMILTYHILQKYSPEFAFAPALAMGYWVFQSRIKMGVKFMKSVYLDKKESVRARLTNGRIAAIVVAVAIFMFLPVWPEFVKGPFMLEAPHRIQLRATVPGHISDVYVQEGQKVAAGTPVLEMRNLQIEGEAAQAESERVIATAKATEASLRYRDVAASEQQRRSTEATSRLLLDKRSQLKVVSPMAGIVLSAHPANLAGTSVDEGDELLEIADTSLLRARIYIPEFAMRDVRLDAPVRLHLSGHFTVQSTRLSSVSASVTPIAAGLIDKNQLQGINPPHYYSGLAALSNDGTLREGATGIAKIFVRKQSIAAAFWQFTRDLIDRRVW